LGIKGIRDKLARTRGRIKRIEVPEKKGVYAVYLKQGMSIPVGEHALTGLVYVGSADNLAARLYKHFKSGGSGSSTLRRSIGAVLRAQLRLVAIPRGTGASDSDYTHYRFTPDGEDRLTAWMEQNLEVGVCPVDGDPKVVEAGLISELEPIFCLKGWRGNRLAHAIKQMRSNCVQEARLQKHA